MSDNLFEHLESGASAPGEAKEAVSRLNAFDHLEIGDFRPPPSPPAQGAAGILCSHCHQANEQGRDTCWACYKPLREPDNKPASKEDLAEITLVIDGNTYRSGDPDTPPEILELMARIRKRGYSPELLAEWQNWRATRNIPANKEPADDIDVKVFKGLRVSVIRLDGKVYTSDDADLSPEMKRLFAYLDKNGVTPDLMDQLRRLGGKVKFRPANTATPSDGDLAFWDATSDRLGRASPPASGGFIAAPMIAYYLFAIVFVLAVSALVFSGIIPF